MSGGESNVIGLSHGWATKICAAFQSSTEGIIEAGRLLIAAKAALKHGEFELMIERDLPFGPRTARQFMKISADPRLTNRNHGSVLPPSWRTLYELTQLEDDVLEDGIASGAIHPEMERKDVRALVHRAAPQVGLPATVQGGRVDDLASFIDAGFKCGTIYADPPWLYSNQATRSASKAIYGGMSVDELCALPVRELAADDAHLHLWTTNGFLFETKRIFDAWGFEFKSSFIWVKPQIGIGNYWRNAHEFLLTAVRGDAKHFEDKNLRSWLECDRGRHSEKPDQVRTFLERASPGPRIELFARVVTDGWYAWGDQVADSLLSQGARMIA